MDNGIIAMNLSDNTACYGRRVEGKPHLWWLRRVTIRTAQDYDLVAPPWARQQAEKKLSTGLWEIGGVITVVQP